MLRLSIGLVLGLVVLPVVPAQAKLVMFNMDIALDDVAKGENFTVGQHDKARIVYDDAAVDPKTHVVKLVNFQHFIMGEYRPARPDAGFLPITDGWLDLSRIPYRLHLKAAALHGKPILIIADEKTRRLSIRDPKAPEHVFIAGPYTIDPTPITGAAADQAGMPASH